MKNSRYWKHVIISIVICLVLFPLLRLAGYSIAEGHFRIESIIFFVGIMLLVISMAPSILLTRFLSNQGISLWEGYQSKLGTLHPAAIATDAIGWAIIGFMIGSLTSLILKWRNKNA